jgi:Zn-dependent peptidase ImmA (M78 family)
MDEKTKSDMESGFNRDFSDVKIHTSPEAVQMSNDIGAQAFTHEMTFLYEGKYNPNSSEGKHLLAHELTHTVQQGPLYKENTKKDPPKTEKVVQKLILKLQKFTSAA